MTVVTEKVKLSTNDTINTILKYVDAVYINSNNRNLSKLLGRNVTLHQIQDEEQQSYEKKVNTVRKIIQNTSYYYREKYDITKLSIQQSETELTLKLTANDIEISTKFSISDENHMQKINELTIESSDVFFVGKTYFKSTPFNTTAINLAIQYLQNVIIYPSKEQFNSLLTYNVKALHIANGKEIADTAGIHEVTSLYEETMLNVPHLELQKVTFTTTVDSAEVNFCMEDPYSVLLRGKLSLFISEEENLSKINSIILNKWTL